MVKNKGTVTIGIFPANRKMYRIRSRLADIKDFNFHGNRIIGNRYIVRRSCYKSRINYIIRFTEWYWLDGAVSLVVLVVILVGTWSLLTDSLRLSLDAVPENVNISRISEVIKKVNGVEDLHHMHIWAMSTTENALTTHLVLDDKLDFDKKMKVVHEIKHQLLHNNIHHATIELESAAMPCHDEDC